MSTARTLLRSLTLSLCAASLALAVEIDPLETIHQDRCLGYLVDADADLGKAPASDPRLAAAEMALVDLALCGDVRDRGACGGIWRQRAHELRALRQAAGVPIGGAAKTFADAVPDLWVDALDGCTAACLSGLDKFPASADNPQARALRCYATGDWRPLKGRTDLGPHEQVALAYAYLRSGLGQLVEHMDHDAIPALTYASIERAATGFSADGAAACLREAVVRASFLAIAPDLPASAATAAAAVTGLVTDDGSGRPMGVGKLRYAMLMASAWKHGETVLAVWNLADAATAGPTGLRAADGTWRMGAVGDRAAQSRLELCQGMWHLHDFLRNMFSDPESSTALSDPITAGDKGWFGAFHKLLEAQWRDASAVTAFGDGIEAELAHGPGAIPPSRLIGLVYEVRNRFTEFHDRGDALIARIAAQQAVAEPARAAGWTEVGNNLDETNQKSLQAAGLTAAAAADPWNPDLARFAADAVTGSIPLWPGTPFTTWTDATVDLRSIDMRSPIFAKVGHTDNVAVRWTGFLVVPAAGSYRLVTESDDGSTLLLDGKLLIENGGGHPMQQVAATVDLTAGPHALDLRWFNWYGGAGMRLLWQPPGAPDVDTIPATALQGPDKQPGLHADEWLLAVTPAQIPDADILDAMMTRMPWRIDLIAQRFQKLSIAKLYEQALPYGQKVFAIEPGNALVGKRYGDCLNELGRTDEAIAAWKDFIANSSDFGVIFANMAVAKALEAKGDLAGAEQYGKAAADSYQSGAMLEFADFLGRQNRAHEGLGWIDREVERYPGNPQTLRTVLLLLAPADPPAADIDEAFKRLAADPGAMMPGGAAPWDVCQAFQKHVLQDRFLAMAPASWRTARNGIAVKLAIMMLETGRPAEAAELFDEVRNRGELGDQAVGWAGVFQDFAARLGKRPDLIVTAEDLRGHIGHGTYINAIDPLLRYMAGDIDRATALGQAKPGDDALELRFYLGIDALTRGDLAQAKADLTAVGARVPMWPESGEAKRFLQWIDAGQPIAASATPAVATPPSAPAPVPVPPPAKPAPATPDNKDF